MWAMGERGDGVGFEAAGVRTVGQVIVMVRVRELVIGRLVGAQRGGVGGETGRHGRGGGGLERGDAVGVTGDRDGQRLGRRELQRGCRIMIILTLTCCGVVVFVMISTI